ncbi:Protein nedd1 [Linnemannia zychae]|nr:Protein nedd1 [Linnemannia zychae]
MDPAQVPSVVQRKRSYSTTAYSSLEDPPSTSSSLFSESNDIIQTQAVQPTCLLATAVGTHILTYEFIDNGTVTPFAPSGTTTLSSKQQPPVAPGQFDGIQMSNERTAFTTASLRWSSDNSLLAVEAHDGRVYLHDNRGKFLEVLVSEPVLEESRAGNYRSAMAWASKNQKLYFAHGERVMNWDSITGRTVEMFTMSSRINALAMKTDDTLLALGQNSGDLDIVNWTTGTSAKLDTPKSFVLSKLEYSAFKKSILGGIGNDGILRLWDAGSTGSAAIYHSFEQKHSVPINGMTFSPFNRLLICTVGLDKRYTLYDVDQKSVVKSRSVDHALTSVTFKNDGVSMAFGTDQGKILLYDLRSTNKPISIVDTNINAPITSIHFQGKRSSTMRRHQTTNGMLKRQNSAGSKPSLFSSEISPIPVSSTPMTRSHTLGDTPTTLASKSIPSRLTTTKTNTGNITGLYNPTGSGNLKSLWESPSTSHGNKSLVDLIRGTSKDISSATPSQDRVTTKVRRPTAPSTITAGKSVISDDLGSFQPSEPPSSSLEGFNPAPSGFISMPATPGKDNNQPGSSSYPNSRTVSPFAFQKLQSQSPSGESSTSSSSINTPPGSPGVHGVASDQNNTNPLKHHHYSSADSLTKSPSRASRAKRRKSFGTLMASGGAAPLPGVSDPLSEEKMEILRGQIVDRVRNVLLDQPTELVSSKQSRTQSSSNNLVGVWPTKSTTLPLSSSATAKPAPVAPIRDLWMQAGLSAGSNGGSNSGLLNSTAAASSTSIGVSSAPSSSTFAMNLDAFPETGAGALTSSFQSKVLEGVIDGCLMEFRAGIRNDIQNMHLELLRQFQIQKMEIEGLLKQYTDTRELQEENRRLQEENQRLRMNY